jgi:hypothetical protein
MVKITKGKTPKPSNENEPGLLAIVGAASAPNNLKALAKAFAPVTELRAVKDLKINRRNARTHSNRQVQQIAASMREFGWLAPSWSTKTTRSWPATVACVRRSSLIWRRCRQSRSST